MTHEIRAYCIYPRVHVLLRGESDNEKDDVGRVACARPSDTVMLVYCPSVRVSECRTVGQSRVGQPDSRGSDSRTVEGRTAGQPDSRGSDSRTAGQSRVGQPDSRGSDSRTAGQSRVGQPDSRGSDSRTAGQSRVGQPDSRGSDSRTAGQSRVGQSDSRSQTDRQTSHSSTVQSRAPGHGPSRPSRLVWHLFESAAPFGGSAAKILVCPNFITPNTNNIFTLTAHREEEASCEGYRKF
jgi:hypothetical protein